MFFLLEKCSLNQLLQMMAVMYCTHLNLTDVLLLLRRFDTQTIGSRLKANYILIYLKKKIILYQPVVGSQENNNKTSHNIWSKEKIIQINTMKKTYSTHPCAVPLQLYSKHNFENVLQILSYLILMNIGVWLL